LQAYLVHAAPRGGVVALDGYGPDRLADPFIPIERHRDETARTRLTGISRGSRGFTGVDARYESPEHPELRVDTSTSGGHEAASQIIEILQPRPRVTAKGAS